MLHFAKREDVTLEDVYKNNSMTWKELQALQAKYTEELHMESLKNFQDEQERKNKASYETALQAGIPQRYCSNALDTRYNKQFSEGKSLWLCGSVGVGKTSKASSILKGWLSEYRSGLMVSSVKFLEDLKGQFQQSEKYQTTKLLVLDDLGKEVPTEWALSQLFLLIDGRYGAKLPMLITSQYTPEGLINRLRGRGDDDTSDAIVSRLVENCTIEKMQGEDRRV